MSCLLANWIELFGNVWRFKWYLESARHLVCVASPIPRQYISVILRISIWIECIDKHAHDSSAFRVARCTCVCCMWCQCLLVYQYWLCKRSFSWRRSRLNAHLIMNWQARTRRGTRRSISRCANELFRYWFVVEIRKPHTRHPFDTQTWGEKSIFSFTFHYSLSSGHHMPTCHKP